MVCRHCLVTLPLTINDALKWLSSLPILMQESFWWGQCSDRYMISLFPHLHTPFPTPPFLPNPNKPCVFLWMLSTMFTYFMHHVRLFLHFTIFRDLSSQHLLLILHWVVVLRAVIWLIINSVPQESVLWVWVIILFLFSWTVIINCILWLLLPPGYCLPACLVCMQTEIMCNGSFWIFMKPKGLWLLLY